MKGFNGGCEVLESRTWSPSYVPFYLCLGEGSQKKGARILSSLLEDLENLVDDLLAGSLRNGV